MGQFNSTLVQDGRLLPGIHGLRGIAAIAVVFFHLVHVGGLNPPTLFQFIGRDFGYGVHLFFILSAFSLMHSTESRTTVPSWLSDYFLKRFFRIAPLFYLMIVFWIVVGVAKGAGWKDPAQILLNLTFTFGFVPPSGIVWGGWSVGVETIFYAIFPVLLLLIKPHKSFLLPLLLLIISIIVSGALRSVLHLQDLNVESSSKLDWSYFSFPSNFCFFLMGLYVYVVVKSHGRHSTLLRVHAPIATTAVIAGLLFSDLGLLIYSSARWDIVLWGVGLSALCAWQANRPSRVVASGVLQYFGERSYSIYLMHPAVIFALKSYLLKIYTLCFPAIGAYSYFICASILIVSILPCVEITYRLIEVPGINLGRRLIASKRIAAITPPLNLGNHEYQVPSQVRIHS